MALDKLVDSAQLDSDLGDVADAIRAKSGGSSQLAFPAGFVSEIGSIQTGGGDPWELIADVTSTENATIVEATIPNGKQTADFYKVKISTEFSVSEFPYWGVNGIYTAYEGAKNQNAQYVFNGTITRLKTTKNNVAVIDKARLCISEKTNSVDYPVTSVSIKAYYENKIKAGCNIKVWRLVE